MAATAPKDVHWLSHAELDATHMATDYYGGENLVAQSSPAQTPAPTEAVLSAASQGNQRDSGSGAPVASLAYALLKMPGFTDNEMTVSFELLHRKDSPLVEISALVEDRNGFIPTAHVALALQFGMWRYAPAIVAVSALPTGPLVTTVSATEICRAHKVTGLAKFTLVQSTSGAKISGPPAFFDIRVMASMADLIADICGSAANTAAKKLDQLWH
jgi:hypothetical protein